METEEKMFLVEKAVEITVTALQSNSDSTQEVMATQTADYLEKIYMKLLEIYE